MPLEQAIAWAKTRTICGLNDWRLPAFYELNWVADRTRYLPAVDTAYFPPYRLGWFRTCKAAAFRPEQNGWVIAFRSGHALWVPHELRCCVRAVRSNRAKMH
jgi:hypothetical protein